ncbi:PREDICTED: methyltransferase-like protein 4 [Ceratosolen solmsi marchali]|uniref:Methyltransferase-like protein 4 n=1 Tax=Ceratosolen solmsi marchali TaxID=326594 RepID=A0AAJ7DXW8_9HYME|nr:PREDICTED: methyltransferase-like protein 4 [Ceratosolen solmsi marchali]
MSILFDSDDGWIISHLDYLNKIYEIVEDEQQNKVLNFNESLFKINTQYLRQNQIDSFKKKDANVNSLKKRRKKKSQILPEDILKENNVVREIGLKLLDKAKNLKIFTNTILDNNEESRLASKQFYLSKLQLNYNFHGSNRKEIATIAKFQNEKYVFPKNSEFYCYDIREITKKLNISNRFDLIILDPPWWNKSIRRKRIKFEESSYKMIYNEELANIPIKNLLHPFGIVAVWCTNSSSQLKYILDELFPSWNIVFKAKWYWLKVTQNDETICNFNDSHGKQPYEQLVFGVCSSNINCSLPDKKVIVSVPSAVHSHKPPLTEILKNFLKEKPKCMEIFARYLLPDWTSWGLEVLKFQHLSLYSIIETKNIII